MNRMIALILAISLLLCACGSQPAESSTPASTAPETTAAPPETTVPATTAPTEPVETTVPIEPAETLPADINPLTGETLDSADNKRPVAIMINNLSKAVPQCGISEADMIYEIIAEGSITRFMAIFHDLSDVGVIGPVRSVRPYFFRIAQHYGAILSSAGGSQEAIDMIRKQGYDYFNGISSASSAFYRDEWRRKNKGYEHSLMTTGEKLMKVIEKSKASTTMDDVDYGFHFTTEPMTAGDAAGQITIWFYNNGKKTTMKYDESKGVYWMSQHGKATVDGNNDSPVGFRNVVVLVADSRVKDNKGHLETQTTGTGKGYYARDGKIIPITWSRATNSDKYVYTDAAGNPVSFGVGKTYVAIVPDGSPFSFK